MNDERAQLRTDGEATGEAKSRILGVIHDRGVAMRPRWHFVLRGVLAALGCAIMFATLLYLASFAVFVLRYTGAWFVPAFGVRGWLVLLLSLPWFLGIMIVLFIVVLEILVRRYSFAYRRPLLLSSAALSALVIFGGVVVGMTSFHGRVSRFASENALPGFENMYHELESWHRDDVHRGVIKKMTEKGFIFREYDGDVLNVVIVPKTNAIDTDLAPDDIVVVFGREGRGIIEADGVRRLSPSDVE